MSGPTTPTEQGKLEARVTFTLEKFDGEHAPGDGKEPVEIRTGGDGLPLLLTRENGVDLPVPRVLVNADGTKPEIP